MALAVRIAANAPLGPWAVSYGSLLSPSCLFLPAIVHSIALCVNQAHAGTPNTAQVHAVVVPVARILTMLASIKCGINSWDFLCSRIDFRCMSSRGPISSAILHQLLGQHRIVLLCCCHSTFQPAIEPPVCRFALVRLSCKKSTQWGSHCRPLPQRRSPAGAAPNSHTTGYFACRRQRLNLGASPRSLTTPRRISGGKPGSNDSRS